MNPLSASNGACQSPALATSACRRASPPTLRPAPDTARQLRYHAPALLGPISLRGGRGCDAGGSGGRCSTSAILVQRIAPRSAYIDALQQEGRVTASAAMPCASASASACLTDGDQYHPRAGSGLGDRVHRLSCSRWQGCCKWRMRPRRRSRPVVQQAPPAPILRDQKRPEAGPDRRR